MGILRPFFSILRSLKGDDEMIPSDFVVPRAEEMCDFVYKNNHQIRSELDRCSQEIYAYYQKNGIYHVHTLTVLTGANRTSNYVLDQISRINTLNPEDPPLVFHEDSVSISSYGKDFTSGKDPRIILPPQFSTKGHDVLVIEDIMDTGLTLSYLLYTLNFETKKPNSIKILTLVDKPINRLSNLKHISPDFKGFTLNKNYFIVGFGLDYKHYFRNLDNIIVIKKKFMI